MSLVISWSLLIRLMSLLVLNKISQSNNNYYRLKKISENEIII